MKENIVFQVTPEQKEAFEKLFSPTDNAETKAKVFGKMLKAYTEKIENVKNVHSSGSDDQNFSDLRLKLNKVQIFALKETVLQKSFVQNFIEIVQKVNFGSNSFFDWQDLYSGQYAGIFNELEPDTDQDSAISKNMANTLINLFMALVVTNSQITLDTPVNKQLIREFLTEQNQTNETTNETNS